MQTDIEDSGVAAGTPQSSRSSRCPRGLCEGQTYQPHHLKVSANIELWSIFAHSSPRNPRRTMPWQKIEAAMFKTWAGEVEGVEDKDNPPTGTPEAGRDYDDGLRM